MRKRNLKPEKREAILNAAVKVFAGKGFYHAKVSDVAAEAGVADGTIYVYFKNKDDLLINLFEDKMVGILQHFKKGLQGCRNAREKMERFLQIFFQLIKDDPMLAEVFQVELRQSDKFLKDYHNQNFLDYLNIIGDILHEGLQEGTFRPELNVGVVKIMVFGALDEVARQWILGADAKYSLEEAMTQASRTVLNGIMKNHKERV